MPYLTGDTLSGETCRTLKIPGDVNFVMCVTGALLDLTYAQNWEQFGAVTPAASAAAMQQMLFDFLASECEVPDTVGYTSRLTLWHAFCTAYIGAAINRVVDTLQIYNSLVDQGAGANGDSRYQQAFLQPGTYTARLLCAKTAVSAQLYIFAANEETSYQEDIWNPLELYSAATVRNFIAQTSFTLDEQVHRIYFQVIGKNASSGGFAARLTVLDIERTDVP